MTKLYLVRHGETYDNAAQILQGQRQGKLNEKGIKQAQDVCELMKNKHIDIFVTSDLNRAIETCKIIAKPHNKVIIETPLLRERNWGDFTGMFIPDLKDKVWPKNIEDIETLKKRAKEFLNIIKKNYKDKIILAVGHGIINKAIQSVYYNIEMNEIKKMANADIRILNL